MPLLDTLEVWFISKPQQRPLSPSAERLVSSTKWLVPPSSARNLKATDFYNLSLYLRCALIPIARLGVFYCALWVVGFILIVLSIWHSYPILFHAGRMQSRVWHDFWKVIELGLIAKGFIFIPLAPLGWALFALILYLPRALFWNRRARRLLAAGETVPAEEIIKSVIMDASVWPPPPRQ